MKTRFNNLLLVLVTVSCFVACDSDRNAERILSNADFRKDIFQKIAENPDYVEEFHATANMESHKGMMMKDNTAMMEMMKENPQMVENMMRNMLQMCEKDSAMCSMMADEMVENPKMMKHMERHIHHDALMPEKTMTNGMKK